MKQVIQNYKTGELRVSEIPVPFVKPNTILVKTMASLISAGTERYMLGFARKNLLEKARSRPDLVKQVIAKAQTEGPLEAYRQAMGRLDTSVPLGYSASGVVIDVGPGVEGFSKGDRVACSGSGYASHAEIIRVPKTLVAKIPEDVSFEAASFVALGGIAIHAVRMAKIALGERVVVLGLGLLGQLAVQILRAVGCRVLGLDVVPAKVQMALEHGAHAGAVIGKDDVATLVRAFSDGRGADAVLIFAATESNEPIELAAEIARERGRVVVPGLVGLNIPRKLFYEKELELVISRAWGPGMYDPEYEAGEVDYPFSFVRWTAQRNMAYFLEMLADGHVSVEHLITHRFPIDRALEVYEMLLEGKEPAIGVVLTYEGDVSLDRTVVLREIEKGQKSQEAREAQHLISIGLIGAGQFTSGTLLPAMRGLKGLRFRGVATSTGVSVHHAARKFGFEYCTTDYHEIINDPGINLVFILTRHGSHARLVTEALRAGKHVFVEKPLAINVEQLKGVATTYEEIRKTTDSVPLLMVGFNRRFSPFIRWLKERFADISEPLAVHCTVNAGAVPSDHWVHDPEEGGGRIIGEVCHFVDLIQYLTGSLPVRVYAETLEAPGYQTSDNVTITLKMANGAIGSITYVAGGDKRYPRERVEVFGGGAVGVIENFQAATFIRGGRKKRIRDWLRVDRGHKAEVEALLEAIRSGGPAPVDFEEYLSTTLATFAIEESLRNRKPVVIDSKSLVSIV